MKRIIDGYISSVEETSNSNLLRDAVSHVVNLLDFNAFAFPALPKRKGLHY